MPRTLLSASLLALVALAAPARAHASPTFAVTAAGPGAGRSAGWVAAGLFIASNTKAPGLSLGFRRGLSDAVDLLVDADLAFQFDDNAFSMLGVVDAGIQVRFTPRAPGFHVGAKLAPEVLFVTATGARGGSVFMFGVAPGLFVGGGDSQFQITVGVDAPMYFAGVAQLGGLSGAGTGFAATVRPYVAVESAVSPSLGVFGRGALDLGLTGGGGVVYGLVQAGLSF